MVAAQNGPVSKLWGRGHTLGLRSSLRPGTLQYFWDKPNGGHTLTQTPFSYIVIYQIFFKNGKIIKVGIVSQTFSQNMEHENNFTSNSLKYADNPLWSTKTKWLSRINNLNCMEPITTINCKIFFIIAVFYIFW